MASAASAVVSGSRSGETVALDSAVVSRVRPVCEFVNTEAARLRNQTIAIGVSSAVGAVLLPLITGIGDPRIPLVLAAGVIVFFFVKARGEFEHTCANIAVRRMIAALNRQLTYKPGSSLTQQQFVAMDLFPGRVERFSARDEIAGRAGNIRYTLHRVQASGAGRGATIFEGVIVRIECPEPFPGHTVIIPDTPVENGSIGPGTRVKKDLVFLKNPVFEQHFSVYASDYYDARRLVTPKLMDVIQQAARSLDDSVRLAFVQRSLFVALPGDAMRIDTGLFAPALTAQAAIGRLIHILSFSERLARAVAH